MWTLDSWHWSYWSCWTCWQSNFQELIHKRITLMNLKLLILFLALIQWISIWNQTSSRVQAAYRPTPSKTYLSVLMTTNYWSCTVCTSKPPLATTPLTSQVSLTSRASTSGKLGRTWKVPLKKKPSRATLNWLLLWLKSTTVRCVVRVEWRILIMKLFGIECLIDL